MTPHTCGNSRLSKGWSGTCQRLLEAFRDGRDVATALPHYPISKSDPTTICPGNPWVVWWPLLVLRQSRVFKFSLLASLTSFTGLTTMAAPATSVTVPLQSSRRTFFCHRRSRHMVVFGSWAPGPPNFTIHITWDSYGQCYTISFRWSSPSLHGPALIVQSSE